MEPYGTDIIIPILKIRKPWHDERSNKLQVVSVLLSGSTGLWI